MTSEPIEAALPVARVFEELGIPYLIGGSVASTLHGEPRFTQDVDFVADMQRNHVEPFASRLESDYYVDRGHVLDGVRDRRMFNILRRRTFVKVDVHVCDSAGFTGSELSRAQPLLLSSSPEGRARVATAEDTALSKLRWYRLGDHVSDRQWRDVLGVLKTSRASLDLEYMRTWAPELEVADLLERALVESGLAGDGGR